MIYLLIPLIVLLSTYLMIGVLIVVGLFWREGFDDIKSWSVKDTVLTIVTLPLAIVIWPLFTLWLIDSQHDAVLRFGPFEVEIVRGAIPASSAPVARPTGSLPISNDPDL